MLGYKAQSLISALKESGKLVQECRTALEKVDSHTLGTPAVLSRRQQAPLPSFQDRVRAGAARSGVQSHTETAHTHHTFGKDLVTLLQQSQRPRGRQHLLPPGKSFPARRASCNAAYAGQKSALRTHTCTHTCTQACTHTHV